MPVLAGAEPFAADGGPTGALLLHGFTGCPQSMRPWGEHLAAAGLTVRVPRLPGHGTRWQDLNRTRWTDWYAEADRSLSELTAACRQVFVMGLSVGGALSLRLAEQRPADVAGLVLVNPSVLTLDKRSRLVPLLSRFVASFPPVGNDVKKAGVTELAYERLPLRAVASLQQLWAVVRSDLGQVTAPLLLFHSQVDHVVEPVNSRVVLDGVSSTDREERVLSDSYHVATLDNDAPAIFAGSLQFVRDRAGQDAR